MASSTQGAAHEQDEQSTAKPQTRRARFRRAAAKVLIPSGVGLAWRQFGKSGSNIGEALAAARETRKRMREDAALPIKSVLLADGTEIDLPNDPSERFELLYKVMQWNPRIHHSQITAARRTKFGSIGMSLVSFILVCLLIFMVPMWLSIVLIPASLLVLAIGAATTFRWALVEYQYTRRSLVTYRVFIAQPDFFRWIFC
ncbi:MAG: hypothetical protein EPN79_10965 [Burkholderiaceae bacterium]|nr:MAG: hypothetical protein EPN79_10965 [Burkholderiaceae bacterium]TBR76796.1 MAG: hypothetical protein EPN64_06110 [Burkholderiaceae bacterium]